MTIPQGKISAKAVLNDIRAGMNNNAVMKKYQLSGDQLKSVLKKLLTTGALSQSEYDERVPPEPKKLTPSFRCTACGATHNRRFIRCPSCGVKVPSFRYEDSPPGEVHEGLSQKAPVNLCWFCGKEPPAKQAVLVKILIANYQAHLNGKITFDHTSLKIPRCLTCQSNHVQIAALQAALKDLDSQIKRAETDWAPSVSLPADRAEPVTAIAAVCAGLIGLWSGLHGAKALGANNVWVQVGLGVISGLVLLGLVFVAADSWLMPRVRGARRSGPDSLSANEPTYMKPQGVPDESERSTEPLLLLKRRNRIQAEKARLTSYTKPESAWVEFSEALALLKTGWNYDLDRPGLAVLQLPTNLAAPSEKGRSGG